MRNDTFPTTYANYSTTELLELWDDIRRNGIYPELQAPRQKLAAMKNFLHEYGIAPWPVSRSWGFLSPASRRVQQNFFFSQKS